MAIPTPLPFNINFSREPLFHHHIHSSLECLDTKGGSLGGQLRVLPSTHPQIYFKDQNSDLGDPRVFHVN